MKKLALIMTVLAVVAMVTASAWADDEDFRAGRAGRREARSESHSRSESRSGAPRERMGDRSDRTDRAGRHQDNLPEAFAAHREEMQQWQQRHRELVKLHQDSARTLGKDHEATKAIAEQLREHMEVRRELHDKFRSQVAERAGRTRADRAEAPFAGAMALRRLDLSAEQQEQIQRILDDARSEIVNDVLTAEQREQLKQLRGQWQERREGDSPAGRRQWERDGEGDRRRQRDAEGSPRDRRTWDRRKDRENDEEKERDSRRSRRFQ